MGMRLLTLFALLFCFSNDVFAQTEIDKGKAIYSRLCAFCHGIEGAGDGPAAAYLNPPPRDFTLGLYKWKSTKFDEYAPSDDDLARMISGMRSHDSIPGWDGMNATSMPGWSDLLGKEEVSHVAAYLKSLAGYDNAPKSAIDLSGKVKADSASVERGKTLFKDRCAECHGVSGRGDATKKLKDDWGARTWPRDLTEGWTFRAGSAPEDIYARITIGIPGTQMPSFADPASKKMMTDAQRWDVANYAVSLNESEKKPSANPVLKAMKLDGKLPDGPADAKWDKAAISGFYLFPQIFVSSKSYTPSVVSVSVKALYNDGEAAFLIEWDDPTNSMPWDQKALEIADGDLFPDSVAVQFPSGQLKPGDRPYFGMGGPKPVTIWQWKGPESIEEGQRARIIDAKGVKNINQRLADGLLTANGIYDNGRWRVVIKGPLKGSDKDPVFEEGGFTPVAFALWDGSNGDTGGRHLMTGWQWMTFEKQGEGPSYLWPVAAGVIVFCGEMLWLFSARKKD
ncbi:MAG: c-type cytochrome [Deltaproteobacteria bacterium]|nr:c-type cytochrome [Deltaproteobacteria bacterium]